MAPKKKEKVKLSGNLNIQKVESLHADLMKHAEEKSNIQLDISGVTEMDFASLQLLYSLKKTCMDTGRSLEIVNVSSSLKEGFEICDFTSMIEK